MRVGPSGSSCRARSQTARSCLDPMVWVVSVLGKGETRSRQVRAGKANVSEPPLKCRKRRDVIETGLQSLARDEARGTPAYCPSGDRHERAVRARLRLSWGTWEPSPRCKGRTPSGRPARGRVPMRGEGADGLVVAMKPGNAGGAREPDSPASGTGQPAMGGACA